jgi:hypothetical protein
MAEHANRLLLVLESATFAALTMGTFTGFVMGAASAAILFEQLYNCVGG